MLSTWTLLQGNLQHWLTDQKVRDQFVICAGSDTEVLWNDAQYLKSELVHKRNVSGHRISIAHYSFLPLNQSPNG